MNKFKVGDEVVPNKKWLPDLLKSYGLDKEKVYTVSYSDEYYGNGAIKVDGLNTTFDAAYFDLIEYAPIEKKVVKEIFDILKVEPGAEYTGGSSSYYKVDVTNPTTSDTAYQAECNDIIEALGLTFAEGNIFKAIWRIAADRNGKKKKGNNSVYDAEKVVFFADRLLIQEKCK